jgi:hypothetical protein
LRVTRPLAWAGALASASFALLRVDWRYPELGLEPMTLPLVAAAIGLGLVGAARASAWRNTALLSLLLLVGQAAALQLIDAPRYAVYQHYAPWSGLVGRAPWVAIIVLQATICLALLWRAWRVRSGGAPEVPPLRVLILVGVLAFSAAVPTVGLARYIGETILSLLVAATSLANVILVAVAVPEEALARLDRWVAERVPLAPHHSAHARWQPRFAAVVAGVVTLTAAGISWFVLGGMPHIGDEVSYLFQARYLAEGQLYLPAPPDSAAFEMSHVVNDGTKWFSKYFPGWPAVLAVGAALGVPWLVNPILAGLTILLTHACLRELDEPWVANSTILLLAASPWFLFMSAGFMGHPVSLVWSLVAIWAVERERVSRRGLWAAVVGLCAGLLFLTRPLEGLLVAPVLGLWAWRGREPRWGLGAFMACGATGTAIAALMIPVQRTLTGDPLVTPFALWSTVNYGPGADVMGFGPDVGIRDWDSIDPIPGHGPVDVILNLNKNLTTTNVELFGWAFGSLGLVALAVVLWRWKRSDLLFVGIAAAVALAHTAYWFPGGPDYGARYWYQALVPLVLMTVRGGQLLADLGGAEGVIRRRRRIAFALATATACALVTFVPWRAWGKHYRYRDIGRDGPELVASIERPSVVFVSSDRVADYESVFNLNPIDLDAGRTVIAWDRGPESRAAVQSAFPDHPVLYLRREPGNPRLELGAPRADDER